jgi:hypothetical protein
MMMNVPLVLIIVTIQTEFAQTYLDLSLAHVPLVSKARESLVQILMSVLPFLVPAVRLQLALIRLVVSPVIVELVTVEMVLILALISTSVRTPHPMIAI